MLVWVICCRRDERAKVRPDVRHAALPFVLIGCGDTFAQVVGGAVSSISWLSCVMKSVASSDGTAMLWAKMVVVI